MSRPAEQQSRPIVVWIGRFFSHDGYGTAARLHVDALRSIDVPVVAVDIRSRAVVGPVNDALVAVAARSDSIELRPTDPDRQVVVVVHDRPDNYSHVLATGRARVVGLSYWETPHLPAGWAGWMSSMDRVWAASEFNRQAFVGSGVPRHLIDTVGHPIDPLILEVRADRADLRRRWPEKTVFLSVVSSVNGRRDLALLVEAFDEAFQNDADVALILKAPPHENESVQEVIDETRRSMIWKQGSGRPQIRVLSEDLSREQIVRLHASADCYVSCERGNGWDLPAMDSIGLDIAVIAVDFGASTEFLRAADSYLVASDASHVSSDSSRRGGHALYSGYLWPYVRPADLAARFAEVDADIEGRVERGAKAGRRVRAAFDQQSVAHRVAELTGSAPPIEVKSNTPASVKVLAARDGWNARAVTSVVNNANVAELDVLSAFGVRPGASVPSAALGYRRALKVVQAHGKILEGTRSRSAMSSVMSVSARPWRPKLRALRRLPVQLDAVRQQYESDATVEALRQTAADFRDATAGKPGRAVDEHDILNRRHLWAVAGPFKTPDEDLERLSEMRGRYAGHRVFVMGNGPSLTRCDLSLLRDEYTMGVNKIHLLFDQIDWRPTFYTLLDWKMGTAVAPEAHQLSKSIKFIPERFRGLFATDPGTYWYYPRPVGTHIDDRFEVDACRGIPSRATVLMTAIQQAFFLGFREIVLIGVDASYTIPSTVQQSGPDKFGTGTKLHLTSTANDDPNHFDPRYFGDGAEWHDPNTDDMHRVFQMMRAGVERHGGKLLNATVGGSLDNVPRVEFDSLFPACEGQSKI